MAIRDADEHARHAEPPRDVSGEDAALLHVALLILRGAPLEDVFSAIAEQVARRLGAEASAVLRFLGDERAVVTGAWREAGSAGFPVNAELDFDRRNSAAGAVRATARPARADSYEGVRGELPVAMRAVGLQSSVASPIIVDDEVWGALVASTVRDQPLEAQSEHRIGDLAELAARAAAFDAERRGLERSRLLLVEDADEARRRLERKLHDGPQQHVLALTLKLRVARSRVGGDADLGTLLDDAVAEALTANDELREFARELYPIMLTERGLTAAVQAVTSRAPMRVNLRELPRGRYGAVAEATAYFVVAQTLAAASRATPAPMAAHVAIAERGAALVVEVGCDRGGLTERDRTGLAERLAAVGGSLADDGGDVLRAEIPIS